MRKQSTDSVAQCLREIGRIPLLTADQEVFYAQQIQRAIAISKIAIEEENREKREAAIALLTPEEQKTIAIGLRARDKMVSSNLKLVVSIAKKYNQRGMEFLDLIQEGSIGLKRAAEKFDPTKGYKFSTYAYWWIRQAITRAIAEKSRTIRLPVHLSEKMNKIRRVSVDFIRKHDRNPTIEELAEILDIEIDHLRQIFVSSQQTFSLQMAVGVDRDQELEEIISDQSTSTWESVLYIESIDFANKLLSEAPLNDREKEILLRRHGCAIGSVKSESLEEIGRSMNLTRERVRQLQTKALRKVRRVAARYRQIPDSLYKG